jgi:homoserine kinase
VRAPASSANLGPGFDSLGLALALHDEVVAEVAGEACVVEVHGEGAADVPRDESHLVASALLTGLERWAGERPPGLRLTCRNRLPHGRGLGSSAAAVVSGLLAARGLLSEAERIGDEEVLDLANRIEGHPDNVAACLLGGLTVSWTDDTAARAVRLGLHQSVRAVLCVPAWPMSTQQARGLLPAQVPHVDAVFNSSRSALLVAALTREPGLLLTATEDRLHQPYRAPAMRPTSGRGPPCWCWVTAAPTPAYARSPARNGRCGRSRSTPTGRGRNTSPRARVGAFEATTPCDGDSLVAAVDPRIGVAATLSLVLAASDAPNLEANRVKPLRAGVGFISTATPARLRR